MTSFEHLSFSPYFVPWRQKVSPILFIDLIFHFIFTTLQAFLLYTSYFEFAIRNHTLLDINQSIFPNYIYDCFILQKRVLLKRVKCSAQNKV